MPIPEEDVAKVRASSDIAAVVSEYSSLKRVGRRLQGLCPFHQEKTPSFSVNPDQGLYYCFGCGASGDVISFVRATEGLDFVEAVERLAGRAGITIRHDAEGGAASAAAKADRERRQGMLEAMAAAVDFYHARLLSQPDGGQARHYLRSRGYDGDTVRRFKIGWAPAGWDQLARSLRRPARVMRESGLAFETAGGRLQDSFRARVIFPIFDTSGRAIALGGRVLPGGEGPKYKNSPETPIYSKRRTLYGLNWAKVDLVHSSEVVICEGYTDVIGFYSAGVPRAVATCGTSLTEEHLKILGGFASRVVLAFDADSAGMAAAARIYEAERRHGFEVAVAALPPGTDPGELAQRDPEALAASIKAAVPYLAFRVDRAFASEDLHNPEGRARAAEAAIAAITEHPNPLVRDQYLATVSDRTRIELAQLRDLAVEVAAHPREAASTAGVRREPNEPPRIPPPDDSGRGPLPPPAGPGGGGNPGPARRNPRRAPLAERDALSLAVHKPAEMAPYLHETLFSDPRLRAAYLVLADASNLHAAIDAAEQELGDMLRKIAVAPEPSADAEDTVVSLCRHAADRAMRGLDRDARLAAEAGDSARLAELSLTIDWLHAQIETISAAPLEGARAELAGPLLAWLVERHGEET
jgi:DNA primase